jgi:cytochrome c oxidase subunit 2
MQRVIGRWFRLTGAAVATLAALAFIMGSAMNVAAAAEQMIGAPVPWGIGLQEAGGALKERIHEFNDLVLYIIVAITIFVFILLALVVLKFNAKSNPVPSKTSHHTGLEIAWTVLPVLILVVIAIPSFRLVYYEDRAREADLTINVQGRQWYWHYEYPDHAGLAFDSRPILLEDINLAAGQLRNLSVDEPLVVPVGANIRVITTGQDVIHSFFVPSLGVQKYTIPGRALETWFRADREGIFYGQCNQICGTNHSMMPIAVRAVPAAEFQAWVEDAKKRLANADVPAVAAPALAVAEAPAGTTLQIAEARR